LRTLAAIPMAVRFDGQLLWTDFLRSQYLHARPRPWLAVVGAVLLALFVWASYVTISRWMNQIGSWVPLAVFGGVLLFGVTYFGVVIPINAYRIFRQQKSLNLPFSIEASSEAFCSFNEFGRNTVPWTHFVKWKESRELILLYHSDVLFNLIPKRFFQGKAQLSEFLSFLSGVRRVG
jgi:YcxB-like protein